MVKSRLHAVLTIQELQFAKAKNAAICTFSYHDVIVCKVQLQ